MAAFSDRLKELRFMRDLTQKDLADALGISKSSVSMYESGAREPDCELIVAIADYFNVSTDYLFGRAEAAVRHNQTYGDSLEDRELLSSLCRSIKAKRLSLGMTQSELAEKMGYTDRSSIAKIENGAVDISLSKIVQFAKVLGMAPGELLGQGSCDAYSTSEDEDISKQIGERIKELLISKGKTQQDLCNDLHISRSTVSSWCNGSRIPRMPMVDRLCRYFGVSRSRILDDAAFYPTPQANDQIHLYEDPVLQRVAERLNGSSDYRILLDAVSRIHQEDIDLAARLLMRLTEDD